MATPSIDAAYAALLRDDRPAARAIVSQLLAENPKDPQAWLMLGGLVDAPAQKEDCLRRVLALDPANQAARRGLDGLAEERRRALAPPPPPAPPAAVAEAVPLAAAPIQSMTPPASYVPPLDEFRPAAKQPLPWTMILAGAALIATLGVLIVFVVTRPSAPVKRPTVSAQKRTTDFFNGFFTYMTRPEFYDLDRRELLLDDLVKRYVVPSQRFFFTEGFNLAFDQGDSPASQQEFVQLVQRVYIANAAYVVESESPTEIELSVRSGEIWLLFRDGTSTYVPLTSMLEGIELTNIDGAWYISDIDN